MKIFSEELVAQACREKNVEDLSNATIGEVLLVAQYLEQTTGIPFIRMDQGSPGLPINKYGVEAEKAALDSGIGSQYPAAAGVPDVAKMKKTLTFEYSISKRNIEGGTGPKSVKQQFVKAAAILKAFKK